MKQPVNQLRGFFNAFFALEDDIWHGFLAGWKGLPNNHYHETWYTRASFAMQLFVKMPNAVRFALILYSIQYTTQFGPNTLARSLSPALLFGRGPQAARWRAPAPTRGDTAAKEEAAAMQRSFHSS